MWCEEVCLSEGVEVGRSYFGAQRSCSKSLLHVLMDMKLNHHNSNERVRKYLLVLREEKRPVSARNVPEMSCCYSSV